MNQKKVLIALIFCGIVLLVVMITGGIVLVLNNKNNTVSNVVITPTPIMTIPISLPTSFPVSHPISVVTPTLVIDTKYKNGTYVASGSYESPGGINTISVTIKVINDSVR